MPQKKAFFKETNIIHDLRFAPSSCPECNKGFFVFGQTTLQTIRNGKICTEISNVDDEEVEKLP